MTQGGRTAFLISVCLFIQKQRKGFKVLEEELGVLTFEILERVLPRAYGNGNGSSPCGCDDI